MANRARSIANLTSISYATGNTVLPLVDDPSSNTANTYKITVANLFGNSSANLYISNAYTFSANTVIVRKNSTPANSTANCVKGEIWNDGTYLYVATANNVIKRVTLSSF